MKNLRKPLLYFGIFAMFAMFFASCRQTPTFEESMLVGKWNVNNTTSFYRFHANKEGKYWRSHEMDETDPGGEFFWKLDGAELELALFSHMTGDILFREYYTLIALTSNTMRFRRGAGVTVSLTRVE